MKRVAWLLVFLIAFGVQIGLERLDFADSLGLWYTAYSAAIYTAIIGVVYVVVRLVSARGSKATNHSNT